MKMNDVIRVSREELYKFIDLAVEGEREECAKLCEIWGDPTNIAEQIRARSLRGMNKIVEQYGEKL